MRSYVTYTLPAAVAGTLKRIKSQHIRFIYVI